MDASLLHEEIDKFFLLNSNLSEVMQEVPQVQVEIIFDAFDHGAFANLGDVVVRPWVMRLVIRQADSHLSLLLSERSGIWRQWYCGTLEHLALYRATDKRNRLVATMPVHEPLPQVRRHFQVDTDFRHDAKILTIHLRIKDIIIYLEN